MEDIDAMFSELLGEIDTLTQSLEVEIEPPEPNLEPPGLKASSTSVFVSLNNLADNDLDSLMADLVADLGLVEDELTADKGTLVPPQERPPCPASPSLGNVKPSESPLPQLSKPSLLEETEAKDKADKIKLALEKLKEAKIRKLVIKVVMNDGSSKALMVDEKQAVRDVLDSLFEKTHCQASVDWTLYETNPILQIERVLEDHEFLVEGLSAWTRDSENKILFLERPDKYAVFKDPQNFYLWKKSKQILKDANQKEKDVLLMENFSGPSVIVPDLEGILYLKEDGKKSWKRRYFLLRASGIYYVPKGKTKTSCDLASFIQFDNVNVYYGMDYKNKHKAPTDFCFVLKHPQIQKDSNYIKYLCCEDKSSLDLWVTSIRVAKYGVTLFDNHKAALSRTTSSYSSWTNRATSNQSAQPRSPNVAGKANGAAPQTAPPPKPVTTRFNEPSKKGDGNWKEVLICPPPPATEDILPSPAPTDPTLPPPPSPPAHCFTDTSYRQLSDSMLPPAALDDLDPPPDFIPLPPPVHVLNSAARDPRARSVAGRGKVPPNPPKRTTPVGALSTSNGNVM
ncbi:amyloid beta A4 precursor protein-binding family B member 1-interacting protein-like [Brienomyrus brachyistius]|uniref:amyloid beta A4 precursor protein-binding family B member 1-interacting protein-like n=1 Tax=Brienomyrus brachyistius TaxID=42636 RepID=UPI0020B3D4BC|nr:amyloid beta A4 precursor protein-binding family B member 1-interacting protein-like [Brienomyrus brachyistius]